MSIWIGTAFINLDRHARYSGEEPYDTGFDSIGELYRSLVKSWGRCTGKVRIDRKDGETWAIGWVFVKRTTYERSQDTYLQETWVTLYHQPIERQLLYRRLEDKS